MKQREAVINFWKQAQENNLEGQAMVDFMVEELYHGFRAGDIEHKSEQIKTDEKMARSYAKALVKDQFKKNPLMNGGVKYEPATKRGPITKDPELKKLKEVLKALEARGGDQELIDKVKTRINEKEVEIQAAKSNVPSMEEAMNTLRELGLAN